MNAAKQSWRRSWSIPIRGVITITPFFLELELELALWQIEVESELLELDQKWSCFHRWNWLHKWNQFHNWNQFIESNQCLIK